METTFWKCHVLNEVQKAQYIGVELAGEDIAGALSKNKYTVLMVKQVEREEYEKTVNIQKFKF